MGDRRIPRLLLTAALGLGVVACVGDDDGGGVGGGDRGDDNAQIVVEAVENHYDAFWQAAFGPAATPATVGFWAAGDVEDLIRQLAAVTGGPSPTEHSAGVEHTVTIDVVGDCAGPRPTDCRAVLHDCFVVRSLTQLIEVDWTLDRADWKVEGVTVLHRWEGEEGTRGDCGGGAAPTSSRG